jgi:tetratricopeptide (TPR) repeat protein
LEFAVKEDKGRAQDIVDACDRELRRVASTKDGVDHAAAGDAALHAKDFAAGAKHFSALCRAFKGSGGEDEIHALAHLALCYEQQSKFGEAASHYDRAAEVCDKTDQASASVPRRAQLAQRAQMCYEKNGEDSKSAASCARETRRCSSDAELALKCAGAFAQRYRDHQCQHCVDGVAIDSRVHAGKEKKSKALVLPALTVAVETATKARKQNPKCLKTASQRLLLATVLDALADGLSSQKQFKDALPKAERALKEYDAVAKAHLRAKNEDENFRARRAAAGCALAVASCRAALHKYDDAGDQFRDASNRYAGVSEFLAVWKSICRRQLLSRR